MADESTTKINIDISELKRNIQEANRLVRLANSEFKSASAGMDNWAKSADGISAKLSQLDKTLASQKTVLSSLEDMYRAVSAEQGENSKGAQELAIKINNQKAAISKTESEIRKWKDALSDLNQEQDNTASASDDLKKSISDQENELTSLKKKYTDLVLTQGKSSQEAKETAKAITELSSDLKKSKDSMSAADKAADELDKSLDNVGESAESASDGFTVLKGAMANLVAEGVKSVFSGLTGLADETREYRNEMAKLDNAFTNNGYSVETARSTYQSFYALLGDEGQATEAVNHLAKLTDSQEDLSKWTTIATGIYGTFGDSLPIEGLTEAANETAKVGQVTGPLADALNWTTMSTEGWNEALSNNPKAQKAFQKATKEGMSAEDAFNEALAKCSTEQERQELIMNSLNGMYGEAGEAYRSNNKDLLMANTSQARLTEAYSKFGKIAEPILSSVKLGVAALLEGIIELTDGVDFSAVSDGIEEGFGYLIDTVLPKVVDGFQWILDNKDLIIAGIVGIGAGFVAWNVVTMIQGVVGAIKAFKAANEGATVAQMVLNLVMKANPIGLVIAAITALVAAFIYLWNTSDEFRAFWINLWKIVTEKAKEAWDAIVLSFKLAWEAIKKAWSYAVKFFSDIWSNIKKIYSVVKKWFSDLFKNAWEGVKKAWSSAVNWFKSVWEGIKKIFSVVKSWFSNIFNSAWTAVTKVWNKATGFFSGIWSNIKSVFGSVKSWFGDIFGKAWEAIKGKFAGWGKFWSGLWTQIKNKFSDIGSNIGSAISGSIRSGLNAVLSTIESTINKGIGLINSAIGLANKLPGINVGKVPTLSLPRLESGGVLKKGQVGLLEGNGAEAVVPLDKNKLWIRQTAKDMIKELNAQSMAAAQKSVLSQQPVQQTFNQYIQSPKALSRLEIYRQTKNQLSFAKGV